MTDLDNKLRELIKNQKRRFSHFIVDTDDNILSEGYKTQYLALHFINDFRLHKSDKLRVVKMEVDKNGNIRT